jgi:lysophospholipase L1-like esterase
MRFDHWFNIEGVDVSAAPGAAVIVALGDSITDGHASTTNGNDRWPDDLARRLLAAMPGRALGVLNEGIGGNRLLLDGLGPNALSRLDRDVLAQPGVRYLIVEEGINDIGAFGQEADQPEAAHEALVHRIIGAYEQIVLRAHTHGIRVLGGTLSPFSGSTYYKPGPLSEADRQAVNRWIRTPGHFDAVIDFDKALRDPARPEQLLPAYDSGDHLHPSPAGYRAMAAATPLVDFAL